MCPRSRYSWLVSSVPAAPGRRLRGAPPRRRSQASRHSGPAARRPRRHQPPPEEVSHGEILGKRTQDIRQASPEMEKKAQVATHQDHRQGPDHPRRATPTSSTIGRTSIGNIKHAMDLYKAENGRYPARLQRVHDRDHQDEQHRPARAPVLPGVWLRREGAQADHPGISRPQGQGPPRLTLSHGRTRGWPARFSSDISNYRRLRPRPWRSPLGLEPLEPSGPGISLGSWVGEIRFTFQTPGLVSSKPSDQSSWSCRSCTSPSTTACCRWR